MQTALERLETVLAKVRALPEEQLQGVVMALEEVTEEPCELSEEELAIVRPALEAALRGEDLTDAETDDLLRKPWS